MKLPPLSLGCLLQGQKPRQGREFRRIGQARHQDNGDILSPNAQFLAIGCTQGRVAAEGIAINAKRDHGQHRHPGTRRPHGALQIGHVLLQLPPHHALHRAGGADDGIPGLHRRRQGMGQRIHHPIGGGCMRHTA